MILRLTCDICGELHGNTTWEPFMKTALKLKTQRSLFYGTVYIADVRCNKCGINRCIAKTKVFGPKAMKIVRAVEAKANRKIRVKLSPEGSAWTEDDFTISIGPLAFGAAYDVSWNRRIPYHELGHAVFDVLPECFDRHRFKDVFLGTMRERYESDISKKLRQQGMRMVKRASFTSYGKTHQQEAWADAFSYTLAGHDPNNEKSTLKDQMDFASQVISNVLRGGKK